MTLAQQLEAAVSGGRDAVWRFVDGCRADVYWACLRVLRNADDAEDATAEALLKAVEAIAGGRGPRDNVSGWLKTIGANAARDLARRGRRRERVEEGAGAGAAGARAGGAAGAGDGERADPERPVDGAEGADALRVAEERLATVAGPEARWFRDWLEGATETEIAKAHGKGVSVVWKGILKVARLLFVGDFSSFRARPLGVILGGPCGKLKKSVELEAEVRVERGGATVTVRDPYGSDERRLTEAERRDLADALAGDARRGGSDALVLKAAMSLLADEGAGPGREGKA